MKRLDLYLGRTLLAATLLSWSVLVALDALFALLGELGDIGRGDYGLAEALSWTLLSLPGAAWQTFPMAVLIGSLLGLGGLASQRELNAFQLAGCSPARLLRASLLAGALMLVAALAVGELLAPAATQQAARLRTAALFTDVSLLRGSGFWVRDGRRLIRVGASAADGSLAELSIFELDETPKLVSATQAATARYRDGEWRLDDVRSSRFEDDRVTPGDIAQDHLIRLLQPELAQLLSRDPQSLKLLELRRYIEFLREHDADLAGARLVYWQRLTSPLTVLAMLLLSVSLVLGPSGRQAIGKRVLIGVLIGLAFKLFNDINAYAGLVLGVPAWFSALLPSLLVAGAGLLVLRRYR